MTVKLDITSETAPPDPALLKEQTLRRLMRECNRVLVAYSGGVDSTYLAYIASREVGVAATCVLGLSPSVSEFQRTQAADLAKRFSFNLETINTDEVLDERYLKNDSNRCYFCKSELYTRLSAIALANGSVLLDGTNFDDTADHRPGRQAAKENGVRSLLAEAKLTKSEIRALSAAAGLPTWDMPASPCLSSRIAYGVPVTIERLSKVERSEHHVRSLGFKEFRVRSHGELARIEISKAELSRALDPKIASELARGVKLTGFKYVTLDLEGFRSGAMNEVLDPGQERIKEKVLENV